MHVDLQNFLTDVNFDWISAVAHYSLLRKATEKSVHSADV
jgi:hypothetical protein